MIKIQEPTSSLNPAKEMYRENCFPNYNVFKLVLITVRLVIAAAIMCFVILFQEYVRPRIMIPSVRRYLSCIVNLICLRSILLVLGFFRFQCQNYRYFDKTSRMMTFRSGWAGVTPRQSIIQFLYFSYLFNPTYVRMIQYHLQNIEQGTTKTKLFYTPLTFQQAFFASLYQRGLDPIIIKGQQELKRFKRRKMLMPTLISECFQQMNGPVLIFLPSNKLKQQPKMHQILGQDIFQNQRRFLRSGVVFISQVQQFEEGLKRKVADFSLKSYSNQLFLLTDICSQLKLNILAVNATQTLKYKYQYDASTYAQFVDEIFTKNNFKVTDTSFTQYLKMMQEGGQLVQQEFQKNSPKGNIEQNQKLTQKRGQKFIIRRNQQKKQDKKRNFDDIQQLMRGMQDRKLEKIQMRDSYQQGMKEIEDEQHEQLLWIQDDIQAVYDDENERKSI